MSWLDILIHIAEDDIKHSRAVLEGIQKDKLTMRSQGSKAPHEDLLETDRQMYQERLRDAEARLARYHERKAETDD